MPAGISKVRQLSVGSAGHVKKQINDLYLAMSYYLHQELAGFGVTAAFDAVNNTPRANGVAQKDTDYARIALITADPNSPTAKEWESNVTLATAANVNGTTTAVTKAFVMTADATDVIQVPTAGAALIAGAPRLGTACTVDPANDTIAAAGDKVVLDAAGVLKVVAAAAAVPAGSLVVAIAAGATGAFTLQPVAATAVDKSNVVQIGRPRLADEGQMVVLVIDAPVPGDVDWDFVTLKIGACRASDATNASGQLTFEDYTFKIEKGAGIDQALAFVDDADQAVTDIVAIDWASLAAGVDQAAGKALTGASRGLSFKLLTLPTDSADGTKKKWINRSFVRQINPSVPKDYREVPDHFDGSAATIQTTIIPTLMLQDVFESAPNSFRNMRGRTATFRAETKERKRFDSSETHYFLGVVGTPNINFAQDNESINQLEATMYRWIIIS
jgi:hypothetical protein